MEITHNHLDPNPSLGLTEFPSKCILFDRLALETYYSYSAKAS